MEQLRRVISALVILPPFLLVLLYAPIELFSLLVLAVSILALYEYSALLKRVQLPIGRSACYVAAIVLTATAYLGGWPWLSPALFLSLLLLTLTALIASQDVPGKFSMLLHGAVGVFGIAWCLSHVVVVRGMQAGQWYLLFMFLTVWVSDAMAMYTGKLLGRHRLAVSLSPKKTWEGAIGGTMSGVATAGATAPLLVPQLLLWQSVLLGFLITLAAQISDLGESMLKRYTGVKDSSGLIPGHGGGLDRIDSMLFAAPTLCYALEALGKASAA
jgi:phosphatidate cytidylyltransferase